MKEIGTQSEVTVSEMEQLVSERGAATAELQKIMNVIEGLPKQKNKFYSGLEFRKCWIGTEENQYIKPKSKPEVLRLFFQKQYDAAVRVRGNFEEQVVLDEYKRTPLEKEAQE